MPEQLAAWKKVTAYGLLFAVAFLVALRQTFPAEAFQERISILAARIGWQVKIADSGPAGLVGVRFGGVTVQGREGPPAQLQEVRASLRLWPLLLGRWGFDVDARAFDGRVKLGYETGRTMRRIVGDLSSVDLTKVGSLLRALGVDPGVEIAGVLGGTVNLTVDTRDPSRSTGQVDVRIDKAVLAGGQVALASLGGALPLPHADLGTVTAKATVKDGKAVFDQLDAKSSDLDFSGDGIGLVLQPHFASSVFFGSARLKLEDGFWEKSGTAALRGVAELSLAPTRGRDGAFHFQLYGTLQQPQVRPAT